MPFYGSEGIPIHIKSVGFTAGRPIPSPRIDCGLSDDPKYGGFERKIGGVTSTLRFAKLTTKTEGLIKYDT